MKIGFYGDSFCEEFSNHHSLLNHYQTYITKLEKHYSADVVNLGKGGSSFWDVILHQFDPNNVPDICIFCWTTYNRLYHPKVKNLTYNSICDIKLKDYKLINITHRSVINAGKEYYKHIHNLRKSKEEMISGVYRFDREVLAKLKNTKIIHFWCFEKIYDWQNGIELPIILSELVGDGSSYAPNHLDGDERNSKLSSLIIEAINAS